MADPKTAGPGSTRATPQEVRNYSLRDRAEIRRRLEAGELLRRDDVGWYFDWRPGESGMGITPVDGRVVNGLWARGEAVELRGFDTVVLGRGKEPA